MRKYFFLIILAASAAGPFLASAAFQLVPCTTPDSCNFTAFFLLVQNFINYALLIAFPITACIFAYAGWLLVTDQGSSKNISKAWDLIKDAGMGFAIMLLGWVAIKFILDKLLSPEYSNVFHSLFISK